MRSATLAKLALTATVGIGALIGQSTIASAGPGPQQGSVKLGPAPTTTIKPIPADPADYCDFHLCLESTPVDPQPDPPFDPDLPIAQPEDDDDCPAQMPNCDKAPPPQDDDDPEQPFDPDLPLDGPDQGCQLTHGCPDDDVPGDDEPCRSDHDARTNCEGGTDGTPTDDGTTGGTGGTDGTPDHDGTTGGSGGHLPKTGVEIMSLLGLGAGGVGIGAVLKRLGRRSQDQDREQ